VPNVDVIPIGKLQPRVIGMVVMNPMKWEDVCMCVRAAVRTARCTGRTCVCVDGGYGRREGCGRTGRTGVDNLVAMMCGKCVHV